VSVLLRAIREPGRELDECCVEMQALLDRHPEWPPRAPLVAAGSFAFAAYVRGDYAALLVHRLAELELAQRAGFTDQADAAESNVIAALDVLGRKDEAIARAELPRAMQLAKKFDLPLLTDWFVLLAARQGRVRAAAKLLGHAQEAYAAHSSAPETEARAARAEAEALCRAHLGETTFRALVEAGRCLDETAVERLVLSEVDDD
jgi:hypothetical protein